MQQQTLISSVNELEGPSFQRTHWFVEKVYIPLFTEVRWPSSSGVKHSLLSLKTGSGKIILVQCSSVTTVPSSWETVQLKICRVAMQRTELLKKPLKCSFMLPSIALLSIFTDRCWVWFVCPFAWIPRKRVHLPATILLCFLDAF